MTIGVITKPNEKGQVVIPKEYRDALGINKDAVLNLVMEGSSICIYPVSEVVGPHDRIDNYLDILKKTKGTWSEDNWDEARKKRETIELRASKKRKETW